MMSILPTVYQRSFLVFQPPVSGVLHPGFVTPVSAGLHPDFLTPGRYL
jgi:hypothetical protein